MPSGQPRVECLFCGTKQKVRLRRAIYFTCKKCGEKSPGPEMVRAMFRHLSGKLTPAGAEGSSVTGTKQKPGTASGQSVHAGVFPSGPAEPSAPARVRPRLVTPAQKAPAAAAAKGTGDGNTGAVADPPVEEKQPAGVGGVRRGGGVGGPVPSAAQP